MADGFTTQDKRLVRLSTALGDNVLVPLRVSYSEEMGNGFRLDVAAFSETHHELKPEELIGTSVTIAMVLPNNKFRYLNGLVQAFNITPATENNNHTGYQISISSWKQLLLGRRNNFRIFQDKAIPEIIESILADYGAIVDYKLEAKRKHKPWRYLAQHNESDENFIDRLMNLAGFSSFFIHDNGKHTLHIFDDSSQLTENPDDKIFIHPTNSATDCFSNWSSSSQFVTGSFEQNTYNYIHPKEKFLVNQAVPGNATKIANASSVNSYYYSENFTSNDEGSAILITKAHQEASKLLVWKGIGNHRNVLPGYNFTVARPDGKTHPDDKKVFTTTSLELSADDISGDLACVVTAVEAGHLVYPSGEAPKIFGLQTATVVGKPGEEIQTDKLGRVKVQFHWDRSALKDGQNTCFLRVMQSFAGGGFGAHFTPRAGQEVVVAFENGNPDRPFVIGALYNAENAPPYADQNGLRAGIRTRSSKGGSPDNCNELYFHDEMGKEEVFFQAEKDFNQHIKNNQTTKIINDKKSEIGNNRDTHVINDSSTKIDNNESVQVGKNTIHKVGKNYSLDIGSKGQIDAGSELTLKVGGSVIKISGSKIEISSSQIVINGSQVKLN